MMIKLNGISTGCLIIWSVFSLAVFAQDEQCDQSANVNFVINDIFELSDNDSIFLHHWANFLHVKTKQKTLINEAAFFLNKCQVYEQDLSELERHFRSKKYIRDARVSKNANDQVEVQTWDNWSLMPTIDFGRKGGKNKFALGIKDRNLLGLAIDTELEYFSNDQRSGYKLKAQFPLYFKNNINAKIRLTSNDDGSSEAFFVEKKFVSFDTKHAYLLGFNNFDQIDTQYENGLVSNQYAHQADFSTVKWQWLHRDSFKDTLRFGLGYTQDKHQFSALANAEFPSSDLPVNRSFSYPSLSVEFVQKDYRRLVNLNVINHIEDFNLGWDARATVGSALSNNETSPVLIWKSQISRGFEAFDDAFWLFEASFEGEIYNKNSQDNRLLLNITSEYFHKVNQNWGGYFKNTNQFSKNQYLDSPIALGGESGVRGFPLQYRHGEHSSQFTFEARYYPHINIYKLIELGAAAFVDTGRVFGQLNLLEQSSPWMTSVGVGARFFSTHSSELRVIHLDLIKPLSSAANVNGIEFRVTTKHSF